jgi:hypothetical protein
MLSLFVCAALAVEPGTIGVATSNGAFRIGGLPASLSGTLTDGAMVEAADHSVRLLLKNGARAVLAAGSSAEVWRERIALKSGSAHVAGPVEVNNSQGVRLAVLAANRELTFTMPGAASTAVEVTGRMERMKDGYYLRDETTDMLFRIKGNEANQAAGQRAKVTGTLAKDGIVVSSMVVLGAKGAAVASSAVGTASKTASTASKTASTTAKTASTAGKAGTASASAGGISSKAIILGVVVAGAGSGAAIGLAGGNDSPSTTTISQ